MKKDLLAPLSKKAIAHKLVERKFEDLELINLIEKFFRQKRGYVFKMPKPNTPVILLLSGGIDSIILWAVLMKKYRLIVYPVVFLRKRTFPVSAVVSSVNYYSKIYQKKYASYFKSPQFFGSPIAQQSLRKSTTSLKTVHSNYFLKNIREDELISVEITGLMAQYAFAAHNYSEFLLAKLGLKINTIFCAVTPTDGFFVKSQTLSSLRTALLDLCINAQDFSLQFTSPAIEKELGFFHDKINFMKWADKNGISLNRTHSCTNSALIHCGKCIMCYSRKDMFVKAGIKDHTFYKNSFTGKIIQAITYRLTKLKKYSSINRR